MSRLKVSGATGLPVRLLGIAGVAVFATLGLTMGVAPATAGASGATVSISPGANGHPYMNEASLTITVGPNSTFAPYSRIEVLECAAPNGVPPVSDASCDGNTANGQSVIVAKDGSFEVTNYTLYALPNRQLAETAATTPVCNATSQCVLYIGQNQNDFTQPKVFSTPFTVAPTAASTPTPVHPATSAGPSTSAGTPRGNRRRCKRDSEWILLGKCLGVHRLHGHHVRRIGVRWTFRRSAGLHRRCRSAVAARYRYRPGRGRGSPTAPEEEGGIVTLVDQSPPPVVIADDDVPIEIHKSDTGADRAFRLVLVAASAIVLAILVAVVVFLAVDGWSALTTAGTRLVTGTTWAPDLGRFDIWPLLIGSIAIAVVALIIALPISLATALMINEYLPPRFRPFLTGVIDLLATVPSIVYGFWGLELISGLQVPLARWLVAHVSFVPFFRTPTPGQLRQLHLRLRPRLRSHHHPHHHLGEP